MGWKSATLSQPRSWQQSQRPRSPLPRARSQARQQSQLLPKAQRLRRSQPPRALSQARLQHQLRAARLLPQAPTPKLVLDNGRETPGYTRRFLFNDEVCLIECSCSFVELVRLSRQCNLSHSWDQHLFVFWSLALLIEQSGGFFKTTPECVSSLL